MKLSFKTKYSSIETFNPVDLPNFTVLTGLNGSGKTHLLESIQNGKSIIDDIQQNEITYFDYKTFFVQDEQPANNDQLGQERFRAFHQLCSGTNIYNVNLTEQFKSFKATFGAEYQEVLALSSGKSLFDVSLEDLKGNIRLFTKLSTYKQQIASIFNRPEIKREPSAMALFSLIKRSSKIPIDMDRDEFDSLYNPVTLQNDFIHSQLSKVFLNYKFKEYEELVIKKVEQAQYGTFCKYKSKEDFRKNYGIEPWTEIEKILTAFDSFDFEITNPDKLKIIFPYNNITFTAQLIHKIKKIPIPFKDLSSGEKVLFALVLSLYNTEKDKIFPKLLLLDEVDASLHPSMTKNLLAVVKNTLVMENNIKVIMVTHSPSTIACADEESIYIVNNEWLEKNEKRTKQEALNVLSNGFGAITFEESEFGMSYNLSQNPLPFLFTEGITDKIILETAWDKLHPNTKRPFYIQDFFDAKSLGTLFSRGDLIPDGIFLCYENKSFFALFDFDSEGYTQWNSNSDKFKETIETDPFKCLTNKHHSINAYKLLLPVPDNEIKKQVITTGHDTHKHKSILQIEHLFYGKPQLDPYFFTDKIVGDGKVITFKGEKKKEFAKSLSNLNKDDFKNFIPIFEKIEEILRNEKKESALPTPENGHKVII